MNATQILDRLAVILARPDSLEEDREFLPAVFGKLLAISSYANSRR
jgi:hypothetical protein